MDPGVTITLVEYVCCTGGLWMSGKLRQPYCYERGNRDIGNAGMEF